MESSSKELLLAIAREAIIEDLTGKVSPTLASIAANHPHDMIGDEGAFFTGLSSAWHVKVLFMIRGSDRFDYMNWKICMSSYRF